MSLTKRLFLGFFVVIITISALSCFIGLDLIDKTIAARIEDKAGIDPRSGRDTYEEAVANIRETVRLSAFWSFFLIAVGGLGLSLLLCYFFIKSTLKPISSLARATETLAGGNLEEQVHLENSPPEIAVLGRSFNHMAQSIRNRDRELRLRAQEEVLKSERLATIGQLAAGVAHEINNPLGSILLFNRLVLGNCSGDSPMRQNLERIEVEVKRCQNIVQGLLEFARPREPKDEPTNLNLLLNKTVALFENQPMFHNVEVVRQFQEPLPDAIVDPVQIQQVFVNIILNAVQAMERQGRMTMTTRFIRETDHIEIGFADTGCGMTKEILNRIFEPFYTTKGVGQGTGLGLSISSGIIQRYGGDIAVSSQIGEGSLFSITLPRERRSA
jgi:two-component system NtrC family sensor kinase